MKKRLIGLALLGILLGGCQANTTKTCLWTETDIGRQYIGQDGIPVTGWQEIDGKHYYFSEAGIPDIGWQEIGGNRYYFLSDGQMALGQLSLDGEEYLMTETGLHTGVYEAGGKAVLYDEQGKLQRNEGMTQFEGHHYYIDEGGTLHKGWLNLFGDEYYFLPSGKMAVGEIRIGEEIYHFSPHGIRVLLVNPWNRIPGDYEVELTDWEGGFHVAAECFEPLRQMLADCREAGLNPKPVSAYRTREDQQLLYENRIQRWMRQGYSRKEATALAGKSVAVPGTSEHQLGLAVDIVDEKYQNLDRKQADTATQKWLLQHCWEYGFILRYPSDAGEITGIIYEPWHYRYVGKAIAMEMKELGITLEEYLGAIQAVG